MAKNQYSEWYLKSGASSRLKKIPLNKVVCVDLETTGVDAKYDEILQLSICDGNGREILNKLYKPIHTSSWTEAQQIHGISPAMVKRCKHLNSAEARFISSIISKADLVIGYNLAGFDKKFLEAVGVAIHKPVFDVMLEFAPVQGKWDDYHKQWKWYKLEKCAEYYGYSWRGKAHDALADVRATSYCFRKMIEPSSDYVAVSDLLVGKNFDAVLKDWSGNSRADYFTYPQHDKFDDGIAFCYVRKLPEGLLSQRAEKALDDAIEERGGRRYKSNAKGAKWTVITDPEENGCNCAETFERDHEKGKKVCYLPDLLDYLGVDRKGFDTRWEAGRKRAARDVDKWLPMPPQLKRMQSKVPDWAENISNIEIKEDETANKPNKTFIDNVGYVTAVVGEELKPIVANSEGKSNIFSRIKQIMQYAKGEQK